MKRLYNLYKSITKQDKLLHFVAGCFIYFILSLLFINRYENIDYLILLAVALIAFLKEVVWDGIMKKGTPEALDFFMTTSGGLFLYLFYHIHI